MKKVTNIKIFWHHDKNISMKKMNQILIKAYFSIKTADYLIKLFSFPQGKVTVSHSESSNKHWRGDHLISVIT